MLSITRSGSVEPAAGHPDHLDADELQILLSEAIPLEGRPRAVELIRVEFDRKPMLRPVSIELVPLDEAVGCGHRQAGIPDELEETALDPRAHEPRLWSIQAERPAQGAHAGVGLRSQNRFFDRPKVEHS